MIYVMFATLIVSLITLVAVLKSKPKRPPNKAKVVIHFEDGDWETTMKKRMVYVPWFTNKVPMYCEEDGRVTLRLMWGDVPCQGYGKQYGTTTWEYK